MLVIYSMLKGFEKYRFGSVVPNVSKEIIKLCTPTYIWMVCLMAEIKHLTFGN